MHAVWTMVKIRKLVKAKKAMKLIKLKQKIAWIFQETTRKFK